MSNSEDLVPKILEKIHGEIQNLRKDTKEEFSGLRRELHQEVGGLRQEVGELRQDTTRRLDLLAEAATRTNTELVGVNERLGRL